MPMLPIIGTIKTEDDIFKDRIMLITKEIKDCEDLL